MVLLLRSLPLPTVHLPSRRAICLSKSTPKPLHMFISLNFDSSPINFETLKYNIPLKKKKKKRQETCVLREATPATKTRFLNVLNQELVFFRSSRSFIYSIFIITRSPPQLLYCRTTKPTKLY